MKISFLLIQYSILFIQIVLIDAICLRGEIIDDDNAKDENETDNMLVKKES